MSGADEDAERAYRSALGCFATGVAVVTAEIAPQTFAGITINSFTSVSLNPRLILWCLDDGADRYDAFARVERFGINILAQDQVDVSSRFASGGPWTIEAADLVPGAGDAPLLPRALARLACRTVDRRTLGDHLVIVGEVLGYDSAAGAGLTYFRGRYGVAAVPSEGVK